VAIASTVVCLSPLNQYSKGPTVGAHSGPAAGEGGRWDSWGRCV